MQKNAATQAFDAKELAKQKNIFRLIQNFYSIRLSRAGPKN